MSIFDDWISAKAAETAAVNRRREIEDEIFAGADLPADAEGTVNFSVDGYEVKITQRLTRSVDSDELQAIAENAGLAGYLSTLFRWKPEVNAAEWKKASGNVTSTLARAITVKPGRPAISIKKEV